MLMSALVRCQSSLEIVADVHPCRGLGIRCPQLYESLRLVNILFAILRFVMSVCVVYISIRIVQQNPIKYYTLNLLTVCFICDTLLTIRECLLIVYLYHNFFDSPVALNAFNAAIRFSTDVVVSEYRLMSLFVVFAMYMLFITPLRMHHFLSGRTWQLFFIGSHITAFVASMPRSLGYVVKDIPTETKKIIAYVVYALLVIIATLTLLITMLGVAALIQHNRKKQRAIDDKASNRRLNLISFLIYCIPLNVLNIPVCLAAMLMVLRILFPDFLGGLNLQLSLSCEAGNEVVQARTIVICLSTVIALAPYRRATLHMCCMDRHKKFSFSQTWINRRISFLPTTTIF